MLNKSPYILYSDGKGNIFEDTTLYAAGRAGWDAFPVPAQDWMELPDGGSLYELPGRKGIGIDIETGDMRLCEKGWAVAAFIPPAHTGLYLAAYETSPDAPTLPLFCYTAAGWYNDKFYVTAVRIENDIRQECAGYDKSLINVGTKDLLKAYPHNRLLKHLMENCCQTYNCPAARNFALARWECPVPTSPACNANCIGCISFQPQEESIVSTQDRLTFKPTAEEIIEFTVPHLETAPFPIISFGQGCEGEPLLMWETIREAIIEIRKHTTKGSININTNGSLPKQLGWLIDAGLDACRVSLNSAWRPLYEAYYQPINYGWDDVGRSITLAKRRGVYTALNLLTFPGVVDQEGEVEALCELVGSARVDQVQVRSLAIDPEQYLAVARGRSAGGRALGMAELFRRLRRARKGLVIGNFARGLAERGSEVGASADG